MDFLRTHYAPERWWGTLGSERLQIFQPALCGPALRFMLECLHLVFKTQFELFESNFFQFFVVGEVSLFGEGFQSLGILRMLLCQPLELIVTGQECLSCSQHLCQTSYKCICYDMTKK
jgi:hypothetical protein